MKKRKLNYRFHDPNPPAVAADYIMKIFVEVNTPKVERAIRAAAEEADQEMKVDKERSA